MVLDAFGSDAGPLLVAGALGGLVRGLVVFRSVYAKGPVTHQVLIGTALDMGTSIIIGAIISMFLHGAGEAVLNLPVLNQVVLEGTARTATAGFLAGFGSIAIAGAVWDFFSGVDFSGLFKRKDAPPPPPVNQPGTP